MKFMWTSYMTSWMLSQCRFGEYSYMSWEDAWYYGPSTGKRTRLENEGLDF